jgi:hypothetical protein
MTNMERKVASRDTIRAGEVGDCVGDAQLEVGSPMRLL